MPRSVQRQREHAPIFAIFTAAIYNIAMIQQTEFTLRPRTRGFHLVTDEIAANLPPLPDAGLVHLFIKHTSAGLSINENADPDVRTDLSAISASANPTTSTRSKATTTCRRMPNRRSRASS